MPTLIVVDDVATDRMRIAGLASRWMDSTVLQASDGKTALQMIELHQPDIVLTDLHMPEMNGLQLVQEIREQYPYIPVILMTADGSEEIAAMALQQGAASYVPKRNLAQNLERTLQQVHVTARDSQIQPDILHQIQSTKTELLLYSERSSIRSTVGLLVNFLRCLPLGDETQRLRTGIAIEEAMLNAYYHGNFDVASAAGATPQKYDAIVAERAGDKDYALRRIFVSADITRERAIFVVRDEGKGFDPIPFLSGRLKPLDDRHRGIQLMATIMDELTYNAAGNEVTMIRNAITEMED
ncbi:MAG TPA: response regulator [Planctomycetaceae bacterium]|nr:response regulator [Planctomycetaceae bacterium]HQZ63715.1 response regulator [Planctomycetaceae bacterium]HRA88301.1 response regulator [Planctomycetaceae bacterium]